MVSQSIVIQNKSGLHLKPAAEFARIASQCESSIVLRKGDKEINPKSVLFLMSAVVKCGDEITLTCTGPTEQADLKTLMDAIESGLGEEV